MNLITILSIYIQTVVCGSDNRVITTLKYSKYRITPTVIHGKPAGEGHFPYLVSIKEPLYKIEPGKMAWSNLCGGSIIGKKKVLTAAHCFESDHFYYAKHPELLRIVAGNIYTELIHDGKTETTPNAQWRRIKKASLHMYFSFPDNDIAIADVDKPWVFNRKVNYVRLATKPTDYTSRCVAAGYGMIGDDLRSSVSTVLLAADIDTISRLRCAVMWEMSMDKFVCTKTAVSDVARGDSGGPLVCMRTGDPAEVKNHGILVGVVSGKNVDKTTLFTRVSSYKDWISSPTVLDYSGAIKLRIVVCRYDNRIITTLKYSKYSITPTIIHGRPAGEGQFPYLVSIKEPIQKLEPGKSVWRNFCGGSIIANKKVLTAAHCFEKNHYYFKKHPEQVRAVAGNTKSIHIHDGNTETTPNGQWRRIKNVILHENFNFPDYDIAIAYQDKPWIFNNEVNYVPLASETMDYNSTCVAAGFGKVGNEESARFSKVLLEANITLIPRLHCAVIWEMDMDQFVCTSTAVTDLAKGDSGGPLVCMRTGDPAEVQDQGILVGVVSGKVIDKTTLFTRVSSYKDWISLPPVLRYSGAGIKLRASVNVGLSIILVVLIYILFSVSFLED